MEKSIDELKFVADLAHNGGMMQAQNEYLRNENARLQHENARLQHENAQQKTELEGLKAEMAELRAMKQLNGQQPTVVVNNFYVLSVPKTHKYVSVLNNADRRFVGHFMHQTLSEGTPQHQLAQIDEMTQPKCSQDERLADVMEELARKPTTQNNYGDYVEGDKVKEKTTIPNVGNYQPQITTQNMEVPMPPLCQVEPKRLEDE